MPAPTPVIHYGSRALTLGEDPVIVRRSDGLDEGQFIFHHGSEDSLPANSIVPGYGGMIVVEDRVIDHAGYLEHNVRATGLRSGNRRLIEKESKAAEDGFDTGRERWIVAKSHSIIPGARHSDYNLLVAVDVNDVKAPCDAYKYVDVQFKGIKHQNRQPKLKVGMLSREVNRENMLIVLNGGHSSAHNWNILLSAPTLQKSYLSTRVPSLANVGLQGSGTSDFPATTSPSFSASDDSLTWNYPNGVVLAGIEYDEILRTGICFVIEHYVKRDKINLG